MALKPLNGLYGPLAVCDFSPLKLKAVRQKYVEAGWCRRTINGAVGRVQRMFKWAVENELAPMALSHGLKTIAGLRKGRCEVPEKSPVRPAPDADIGAVVRTLSPSLAALFESQQGDGPEGSTPGTTDRRRAAARVPAESPLAAMIVVQLLTGMRPGELVSLRRRDLHVPATPAAGGVWTYVPQSHKTEHHGNERVVRIGPRAQEVLLPFLDAASGNAGYLFSPKAETAARRTRRRNARKSRVQPSQLDRSKPRPKRAPGDHYTPDSYRRAVAYACEQAGVPRWHPNQLRHNAATAIRKTHGLDAARAVLGQQCVQVTEIYAERDRTEAAAVMAEVG